MKTNNNKMTRNVITSMLLVAITLMTVGCNKEKYHTD